MAFPRSISIGVLIFVLALFSVSCTNGRRGEPQQMRQLRQLRPTRGFKEMELAAARNFGKRAVNMHVVNSILIEWLALENKMKGLRQGRNLLPQMEQLPPMVENSDDIPTNGVLLEE